MPKKFFAMLLIILGLCRPVAAETVNIAVMDLGTHEGAVPIDISIFNAGKAAAEYLLQHLFKADKFNVIDRTLVEGKMREANLNTTGLIDPDTAKKIGKLLGVRYLVYGNVNDVTLSETGVGTAGVGLDVSTVTVKAHIIVRVMDIETGKIISAAKGEGKSKASFVRVKGGPVLTLDIGRTKVTQDSVHNALQQAAFQTVENLLKKFFGNGK